MERMKEPRENTVSPTKFWNIIFVNYRISAISSFLLAAKIFRLVRVFYAPR